MEFSFFSIYVKLISLILVHISTQKDDFLGSQSQNISYVIK
jgi:hypothetical protein